MGKARLVGLLALAPAVLPLAACSSSSAGALAGEWRAYGATAASTKYSPLDQITRANAARLRIAWRWPSPDAEIIALRPGIHPFLNESTPLMAGGVLYTTTSLSQVAAIDAATGRTLWRFDPKSYEAGTPVNLGFTNRGLAYWTDGKQARLVYGTGDGYLIALDAATGRPVPDFGVNGRVDLTQGLRRPVDRAHYGVTSPPLICRDVVVVGSTVLDFATRRTGPPGDVRGFDVRTGRLRWTFHTVPLPGEPGFDTWEDGSAAYTGNTNVWTAMSADEELGYVYLPVGTPTNDWYGGHRRGDNLFADSLVAVEAETGRRVWHYQMVHHGLWDYDPPAAPVLADLTVGGRRIKAVAQVTKQGFCYVFDRVTGEPVWPIEERPVPSSDVPGERTSPTQPFPTRPAPFERQGLTEDDLIDFTPELRAEAVQILKRYRSGPLFTPPSVEGTLTLPSWVGGASWSGAALDPATNVLYVTSITAPSLLTLAKPDPAASDFAYAVTGPPRGITLADGLPLVKPPYGRVTAVDLDTGAHVWMAALGSGPRDHPRLKGLNLPRLGWPARGAPLVTRTLLFVGQEAYRIPERNRRSERGTGVLADFQTREPKLFVFDKATGELVAEIELPTNASGAPMTYLVEGRQFVVVPVGGGSLPAELVALALP